MDWYERILASQPASSALTGCNISKCLKYPLQHLMSVRYARLLDNFLFLLLWDFLKILLIRLPLNLKESSKRKDLFKNILNRIVNSYHDKFLKKKNIRIGFDPLIEKTWYHSFNPDEIWEADKYRFLHLFQQSQYSLLKTNEKHTKQHKQKTRLQNGQN